MTYSVHGCIGEHFRTNRMFGTGLDSELEAGGPSVLGVVQVVSDDRSLVRVWIASLPGQLW